MQASVAVARSGVRCHCSMFTYNAYGALRHPPCSAHGHASTQAQRLWCERHRCGCRTAARTRWHSSPAACDKTSPVHAVRGTLTDGVVLEDRENQRSSGFHMRCRLRMASFVDRKPSNPLMTLPAVLCSALRYSVSMLYI